MKPCLLDVNLLIALAWPSHVHHAAAHAWFGRHAARGWATCPITQCGFVRISSNPAIASIEVSPRQALAVLRQIIGQPHHHFWNDDILLCDEEYIHSELIAGHRQITDAYLLGLAIRHGGHLATLDKGIRSLLTASTRDALELIPL